MANWEQPVILVVLCLIFIFAYYVVNLQKRHFWIKMLLFFTSFILGFLLINIGVEIAIANTAPQDVLDLLNSVYLVQIISFIFVILIMSIYLIRDLLLGMGDKETLVDEEQNV